MSLTNCRFYENKYPDLEEFVMVNVRPVFPLTKQRTNLIYRSNKYAYPPQPLYSEDSHDSPPPRR